MSTSPGSSSHSCSCDVSRESPLGQACNEEAFRHFLTVERQRSRRSGRPFLLLLVRLKKHRRLKAQIDSALAGRLFASLRLSLRETDQVGWFREGFVAGALLIGAADSNTTTFVCNKVHQSLEANLPPDIVSRLDVRAHRLGPQPTKGTWLGE
jgi:hypothetical protein